MADEELDFSDRYADVPAVADATDDEELNKKKLELLKLATPAPTPAPVIPIPGVEVAQGPMLIQPPPQEENVPARALPEAPVEPPAPQTFFDRLLGITAPKFLPGAPSGMPPPPPPAPEPKAQDRPPLDSAEAQELEKLLSKEAPVSEGFQPGPVGPSKDLEVRQRTDVIKEMRAPLKKEIDNDPQLKRKVLAMIVSEGVKDPIPVMESLYNRALYTGKSIRELLTPAFYGPMRPSRHEFTDALRELDRNPKLRAKMEAALEAASTSNEIKGATDQGLPTDPNGTIYRARHGLPPLPTISRGGNEYTDWGGGPGGTGGAAQFRKAMQNAAGQPYVANADIAPFLSPELTANQKVPLTGGLTNTEASAAQTAALMTGTPLEKIKNAMDVLVRKAPYAGPGRAPARVTHTREGLQPQAPLPQQGAVTRQYPDQLPVPGMPTPGTPMTGPEAINALSGPSLLATIMQEQKIPLPIPPEPKAGEQMPAQPGTLEKIVSAIQALRPSNWGDPRELLAGIAQQPTNAAQGTIGNLALLTNLLTGSQTADDIYKTGAENVEAWRSGVRSVLGLPETTQRSTGEQVGQIISPSIGSTLFNAAVTKGSELIAPFTQRLAEKYPIPDLVGEAHAGDSIFGEIPTVINTPAGPVVMNRATKTSMIYGAIPALGVGFLPTVLSSAARVAMKYPSRWIGGNDTINREVVGAPGTFTASMPQDVLKAVTVDPVRAMQNTLDRMKRMDPNRTDPGLWATIKGQDHGIDPVAAEAVRQRWKVQTNSGGQIHINNAIENGFLNTREFRYDVRTSIKKIDEYARANPDFMHYLKFKMIDEQLTANRRFNTTLPSGNPRTTRLPAAQQKPLMYPDDRNVNFVQNNIPGGTNVRPLISAMENSARGPEFKQMYQAIQENLEATRNFISDHPTHNVEDPLALMDHAAKYPSMPIFGARQRTDSIMGRLMDNHNPISIIEDNIRYALRKQMNTDAKMVLIDHSLSEGLKAFVPRDGKWLKSRGILANEKGALLKIRVGGKARYFTADPFLVSAIQHGDIPLGSLGSFVASIPKKGFTWSTTGPGAPWFSWTAMGRAIEQGTVTHPQGLTAGASGRSIPPVGMIAGFNAIWRSAGPQMAHLWADRVTSIENWIQQGPLNGSIPTQHLNTFARALEDAYTKSVYYQLKQAGMFSDHTIWDAESVAGKVAQQKIKYANTPVSPMIDMAHRAAETAAAFVRSQAVKRAKEPYGAHVEIGRQAVSDSAAFAFAHRLATREGGAYQHGMPLHMSEIAALAREHTGDPSTRGVPFTVDMRGNKIPYRTQFKTQGQQDLADAAVGFGRAANQLREATPWAGVLVQSPAATIRGLRENPVRANMYLYATAIAPEVTAYLWNMYLGQEYLDWMENGQSEYDYNNYTYFGVPGQKPYKGVKVIQFQENVMPRALTKAYMKQWAGRATTTLGEDFVNALKGFAQTNLIPPITPWVAVPLAGVQGMVAPGGIYGGEMYKRKVNPFDPGYHESYLELALRQAMPGIADIALQIMHAAGDAPAWADVPKAAWKQGTERVLEKTNVWRDAARIIGVSSNPPVTGSPTIQDDLFKYDKMIQDMARTYEVWDVGKGRISMKGQGVSPYGMNKVKPFVPELPPTDETGKIPNSGLTIGDRKNPLWVPFMKKMEETFRHDSPQTGGVGYKSLWKNYSIWTQELRRMNTVSRGDDAAWIAEQKTKPKQMAYLQKNGIDPLNYKEVRNFYTYNRELVAKVIVNTIKATEQKFDQDPRVRAALGPNKKFSLDMLKPDKGLD